MRQSEADLEAARSRVATLEQQATVQVWTDYAAVRTAAQRIETSGTLLQSAEENERAAAERYRAGVGSILDLLTAQSTLASARAQEVQARADWLQALAQLAHDTGALGRWGEKDNKDKKDYKDKDDRDSHEIPAPSLFFFGAFDALRLLGGRQGGWPSGGGQASGGGAGDGGTVLSKTVPVELEAVGKVEPLSTVDILARVGGELTSVQFTEGQEVRKGQVLFTIDPRPYQAALAQAQAALARDRAVATNSASDLHRYGDLVKKDYVTREQYDRIAADKAAADATVQADRAAVEAARLQLGYCTIRAPLTGRTGSLLVHAGNLVKANDASPLVMINQIQPIYVSFAVPESQLRSWRSSGPRGAWPSRPCRRGRRRRASAGTSDLRRQPVDRRPAPSCSRRPSRTGPRPLAGPVRQRRLTLSPPGERDRRADPGGADRPAGPVRLRREARIRRWRCGRHRWRARRRARR